ncbi:3-oxoacyl-ACP reductase FabG [Niabella terrae]
MNYALVTGGSRGIGKAICIRLAAMGYPVLINYKSNRQKAEETLEAVVAAGSQGSLLPFDVADRQATEQALREWSEVHPEDTIEVLVNNAGIKDDVLMMWMKDEQWDQVLGTSLGGFFNVTRIVVGSMLRQRYGRIVNVVSLSGLKGMAGQTNYSAAKGGIIAATKALAQEVGKRNITVNAVAPGFISTDMTADIDESQMKQLIPAGRFGSPEEVAYAVGTFIPREAAYITGQVLSVNGGLYT